MHENNRSHQRYVRDMWEIYEITTNVLHIPDLTIWQYTILKKVFLVPCYTSKSANWHIYGEKHEAWQLVESNFCFS